MNRRIALIQMTSTMEVENNLATVSHLVQRAAGLNVDAIFLPENFAALSNPDPRMIGQNEDSPLGRIRKFLSDLSREVECWVFAGTLPTSARSGGDPVPPPRVRAASLVYDHSGREVARYDKIHMFDVDVEDDQKHYMESATFEAGEEMVCVDSPLGLIGLSVCYDIRFPELYRHLFVQGAKSFAIPCAFTEVTGGAHYEILMRSRAIENFSFTIAACQGGLHDSGRRTYGHSMVVSPWGDILAEGVTGDDVIVADLDFGRLDEIREAMPVLHQRRLNGIVK